MAQIDDLPADQQAVLRLLLTQERSYEEIARSLKMASAAVRDRALEALTTIGPASGQPDAGRRAEITDYLLGQQDAGDAAQTRAALERSASERGWARVVSTELRPLASRELPQVPGGSANGVAAILHDDENAGEPSRASRRARARAAGGAPSSRRGGAILLGALGIVAALAIGFLVGRWTSDDEPASSSSKTTAATSSVFGQANLQPPAGSSSSALAVAYFLKSNGENGVGVTAQKLAKLPQKSGYPIWLTGKTVQPLLLGYIQQVDAAGAASGVTKITKNPRDYDTVILGKATRATPKTPDPLLSGAVTFKAS